MNKGRPLDQIWTQFEKTNTGKAKWIDCGCEFAALVERMKTHYSKFHALQHIKKAKENYGIKVCAVVTDNAENMNSMRKRVKEVLGVEQYGCSAHQLNLLAKDLVPLSLINKVVISMVLENQLQKQ